jgi:hypothetical protein
LKLAGSLLCEAEGQMLQRFGDSQGLGKAPYFYRDVAFADNFPVWHDRRNIFFIEIFNH